MRDRVSVLACLLIVQGCASDFVLVPSQSEYAISLSGQPSGTFVRHFIVSTKIPHLFGRLFSPKGIRIDEILRENLELEKGVRVVNLRIEYTQTFWDGLVVWLTLGMYMPYTLTLEGDIVR
jgi:hypothetical protein